jgi:CO/xanthine dehydrogenase Mo-binding subunit
MKYMSIIRSSYKGGRIVGMASNAVGSEASTVQAFMMCSLLSSNKDVAAMVPVKNLTGYIFGRPNKKSN